MKEPGTSSHRQPIQRYNQKHFIFAASIIILCYFILFHGKSTADYVSLSIPQFLTLESKSSSPHVKAQLLASERAYQRYVKQRKEKVGSNPEKINPWPPTGATTYYYDYFLPAFSCPHTTQRIGKMGDGGKWTCGFDLFEKPEENIKEEEEPCIVYSFGVAGESSYEAEFIERTNCEIYAFDASVDKMGPQITNPGSRVHFEKTYIGKENNGNTKTLGTIMKENGHTWIDFLKMDIEENEYAVLNQISDEFEHLPFGQLQVEIHGDNNGTYFPVLYKLWERLEEKGLRAFQNEVNHWPCVGMKLRPFLMEYGFINIRGEHRIVR